MEKYNDIKCMNLLFYERDINTLRNIRNFLIANEQYGDDFSEEIRYLTFLIDYMTDVDFC